jgi:hypothetical protein
LGYSVKVFDQGSFFNGEQMLVNGIFAKIVIRQLRSYAFYPDWNLS